MASGRKDAAGLTERDRFWLSHLEQQASGSEPSTAYAARAGLSVSALYQARSRLLALGVGTASSKARAAKAVPQFTRLSLPAPAAIASAAPACRVRLASGAVIEWSAAPAASLLAELIGQLAR